MKLPKKKFIFIGGGLIVLAVVLLLIASALPKPLQSQRQAERWAGESGVRFAQFSCFLSPAETPMQTGDIALLRQKLTEKLTAASVETPPGGRLFCDAWSATGKLKVKGERGSFDAVAVAVGGSYFDFHPMALCSGAYLAEGDLMRDRVVLDAQLAWLLYGSTDLAGLSVEIGGQQYFIAGVVEQTDDRATSAVSEAAPTVYLPCDTYLTMDGSAGIDCYEIVLPEPAEGFAASVLKDCFAAEDGVTRENTGRFRFGNSLRLLKRFSRLPVRTEAVAFPAWENAALLTETRCAILRAFALLALVFPAALLCTEAVRGVLYLRRTLRGSGRTALGRLRDRADERRMRRDAEEKRED